MRKGSMPIIVITVISIFIGCFIIFSTIYAPEIVLRADDAFKTLTIKSGTFFTIELETNPSTGYSWTYSITNNNVIQYISSEYIPPKDTTVVGASGIQRFVFRGMSDGETSIKMKYEKSYAQQTEPAQFRDFKIIVK